MIVHRSPPRDSDDFHDMDMGTDSVCMTTSSFNEFSRFGHYSLRTLLAFLLDHDNRTPKSSSPTAFCWNQCDQFYVFLIQRCQHYTTGLALQQASCSFGFYIIAPKVPLAVIPPLSWSTVPAAKSPLYPCQVRTAIQAWLLSLQLISCQCR